MNLKILFFALSCTGLLNADIIGAPKPAEPIVAPQQIAPESQLPITVIIYDPTMEIFKGTCLDSVLSQEYESYQILYLCDMHDAHALDQANSYLSLLKNKDKVTLIPCNQSHGKLKVLYDTVHTCNDNEIIVILDAHDWLAQPWALTAIARSYLMNDSWLTYGSCIPENKNITIGIRTAAVPAEIIETRSFRDIYAYTAPHSFYAWLFKLIKKENLIDPATGDFYMHAAQCHIIWPLIEMAADHFEHIKLPLHTLNCQDPLRMLEDDHYLRVACNEQLEKQLPVYTALESPIYSNIVLNEQQLAQKRKERKEKKELAHALAIQFQLNTKKSISPTKEFIQEVQEAILAPAQLPLDEQLPITILMYAQNAANSIIKSLDSIFNQQYQNYRILIIDDASSDDTIALVKNYISLSSDPKRVQLVTCTQPKGKLQLLYTSIAACCDNEIILLLDAHDCLAHGRALETIALAYNEPQIWLTYGTAVADPDIWNMGPCTGPIPQAIIETQEYRKIYPAIPPCTFYAWLFKKIQLSDVMDPTTHSFFEHAAESHIMWPLMELAHTHMQHLQDVIYVVNYSDVLSKLSQEHYTRAACNGHINKVLPLYQPLTAPIF